MIKALKTNQLIENYSLELLKFSLSGDQKDFWKAYDQMIETLGYTRVIMDSPYDSIFVIKQHQNRMYHQYKAFNEQKIQNVDLLQIVEMKKYWEKQRQHSDKFQLPNFIHCILTPLSFSLSLEICKISDYKLSSYAFYLKDHVVYSNKTALNKGILQGLPILLARKIDPDTKFVELNRYSQHKFQEIYEIFKEKHRQLNPFMKGQQIRLTFKCQKSYENLKQTLKNQMEAMLEEIYEISGLRMFAFVSKNQVICDILIKDTPLTMIQNKNSQITIVIDDKQMRQTLEKCRISSVSGFSLNQARFLSPNIKTVGQLLNNLEILQMITSQQQTQIFMQTCLGIDHRQNLQYVQMKRKQFSAKGLNYDQIVSETENTNVQLLLQREKMKKEKNTKESRDFDSKSVRSQKMLEVKKEKPENHKNPLNIVPVKNPGKQQYFPMFGKNAKK